MNEFSTNLPSLRIGHSALIYKGKGKLTKNLNWSIATGKFHKVYCLQGRPLKVIDLENKFARETRNRKTNSLPNIR